jgi:hypothetical protein
MTLLSFQVVLPVALWPDGDPPRVLQDWRYQTHRDHSTFNHIRRCSETLTREPLELCADLQTMAQANFCCLLQLNAAAMWGRWNLDRCHRGPWCHPICQVLKAVVTHWLNKPKNLRIYVANRMWMTIVTLLKSTFNNVNLSLPLYTCVSETPSWVDFTDQTLRVLGRLLWLMSISSNHHVN